MTTTDVATVTELTAEMDYARAVAPAALLPVAYRGKPADILIAIGLGKAIGVQPAQALYEIYVVNGRPSPSANLMAALVRRAGHKLRIDGDATRCTATLVRSDDPDYPFSATWTFEQARLAGLTGKDTWKAYPGAMLRARAIAEVVRMGASEAVLGMDYSREEMEDVTVISTVVKPRGLDAVRAAVHVDETTGEVTDAEIVEDDAKPTQAQMRRLHATFTDAGVAKDARHAYASMLIGREITSANELTAPEVSRLIDALKADVAPLPTDEELA